MNKPLQLYKFFLFFIFFPLDSLYQNSKFLTSNMLWIMNKPLQLDKIPPPPPLAM